jgi:hypothetical protein
MNCCLGETVAISTPSLVLWWGDLVWPGVRFCSTRHFQHSKFLTVFADAIVPPNRMEKNQGKPDILINASHTSLLDLMAFEQIRAGTKLRERFD